jgi:hypothetical protein
LWRFLYGATTRAIAWWLLRPFPGSSVYLRAGLARGDVVYGLSDLDLALVVPDRDAVMARRERLFRRFPLLRRLVHAAVYEEGQLETAVSASPLPTCPLDLVLYSGPSRLVDSALLGVRFAPRGPASDWRLVRGPDRRPAAHPPDRQQLRVAAWLELQFWWRQAFLACAAPRGLWRSYLCLKLVAEPLRILLWLEDGLDLRTRADVLERARELVPEESEAIERAQLLRSTLADDGDAPLAAYLPVLVRLSERIAATLAEEVAGAGTTEVRLVGGDGDEQPLVDWRAVVWPDHPVETFRVVRGDPGDPAALASAARHAGSYRALRAGRLLVLPSLDVPAGVALRAVQCELTDPVSFALVDGRRVARFPNVAGWSARAWAERAVREHGDARAVHFLRTLDAGAPELQLR